MKHYLNSNRGQTPLLSKEGSAERGVVDYNDNILVTTTPSASGGHPSSARRGVVVGHTPSPALNFIAPIPHHPMKHYLNSNGNPAPHPDTSGQALSKEGCPEAGEVLSSYTLTQLHTHTPPQLHSYTLTQLPKN